MTIVETCLLHEMKSVKTVKTCSYCSAYGVRDYVLFTKIDLEECNGRNYINSKVELKNAKNSVFQLCLMFSCTLNNRSPTSN